MLVEHYYKSYGSPKYRDVYFHYGHVDIEAKDLLVEDDATAKKETKLLLELALDDLNKWWTDRGFIYLKSKNGQVHIAVKGRPLYDGTAKQEVKMCLQKAIDELQ